MFFVSAPPPVRSFEDLEFTRRVRRSFLLPAVTARLPVGYREVQPTVLSDPPDVSLSAVGGFLGLDSDLFSAALQEHDRLLRLRGRIIRWTFLVVGMTMLLGMPRLERSLAIEDSGFSLLFTAIGVLAPTLVAYATVLLLTRLTNRSFADSLAAVSVVSLLLELSREDALSSIAGRQAMLYRIRALSRATKLLGLKYSTRSTGIDSWAKQHFAAIDAAIRERERWVIAPRPDTRTALYEDVRQLAPMYILGEFGRFAWPASAPADGTGEKTEPVARRVLAGIGRALAFVLPLLLLWYLLTHPDQLRHTGLSANVVGLFFIAWMFLTFDAVLKMGIVANVVSLAKGIKELK